MKKTAFTEKHRISTEAPSRLVTSKVTVANFATSLHTFLEENFHGSVDIDSDAVLKINGFITLCPEYIAYFFKLVLVSLHGAHMLYVKMDFEDENKLVLRVESPGFADMSSEDFHEIVRAAGGTQFIPCSSEGGFVLKKSFKTSNILSLYSVSNTVMRDELYRIFFAGYDDENNLNFFKNLKRK